MDEKKLSEAWDELHTSPDFRTLWRMVKGESVLSVDARVQSTACTEIWLREVQPGKEPSVSRETFEKSADCEAFLMAKKTELQAEGWRNTREDN